MILPKDEDDIQEEDPRLELTQRLEEYKRMKMAAEYLREKEFSGGFTFYKMRDYIQPILIDESLKLINLDSLRDAAQSVVELIDRKKPVSVKKFSGIVGRDPIPVFTKVKEFVKRFLANKKIKFKDMFKNVKSRDEAVASFLAVLELMKMNKITVGTEKDDYEITYLGKGDIDENEYEHSEY